MQSKLLQKIEEFTLYTIQQQKEIEELKAKNGFITTRLEKIEKNILNKYGNAGFSNWLIIGFVLILFACNSKFFKSYFNG